MSHTVRFDGYLYDESAVSEAATAYAGLATIAVAAVEGGVEATLSDYDAQIGEELVDRFCNHALFATVAARRA